MRVISFWVAASALAGISHAQVFDTGECLNALRRHPNEGLAFCKRFLGLPATVTAGGIATTIQSVVTDVVTLTNSVTRTVTSTVQVTSTLVPPIIDRRDKEVIFGVFDDEAAPAGLASRQTFPFPWFLRRCSREEVVDACTCFLKLNHVPTLTTVTNARTTTTATVLTTTVVVQGTTRTVTSARPVATVNVGNCNVAYLARGNGQGNHVEFPLVANAAECCQTCKFLENCVASAFGANGQCQHLIRDRYIFGAVRSDTCPLGSQDYDFGPASPVGLVYAGPCGY